MSDRIRTIQANGHITVLDLAFSQIVALLSPLSPEQREDFWSKKETKMPNGNSIYLVQEGV